jgi:hypothetical protein
MAIAKWIPFGAQSVAVASATTKPQHVQATPADGKQFGLENVRNIFSKLCASMFALLNVISII